MFKPFVLDSVKMIGKIFTLFRIILKRIFLHRLNFYPERDHAGMNGVTLSFNSATRAGSILKLFFNIDQS